ncbi:pectin lyase [Rhexocercosporidium sp. MPI-PUGE-AT-0058]|nr:pectin lyase [Rhexocercosporidium sp. MPI-PUGE-AT-0058]
MYSIISLASLVLLLSPSLAVAQVNGTAYGFATGTTGGGNAAAAAPKNIAHTPRVIIIDKNFNFIGSEGKATEGGCYQTRCTPAMGGQTYIGALSCGGSRMTTTTIKYDKADVTPLVVGSNKRLHLPGTTKNVIIQNVHITPKTNFRQNVNPASVWGGDALSMDGNGGVWIDHCKFSKMRRMFIISHYVASRFTGTMFMAEGDQVIIDRNYWHDMLGRSPKLGADGIKTTIQATNNYFYNHLGYDFEIYLGTTALIEGNRSHAVNIPMHDGAESIATIYNVLDAASASACTAILGRACESNAITSSGGTWPSLKPTTPLNTIAALKKYLVTPIKVGNTMTTVLQIAGVGKITV